MCEKLMKGKQYLQVRHGIKKTVRTTLSLTKEGQKYHVLKAPYRTETYHVQNAEKLG